MGNRVHILDSASACAVHLANVLKNSSLQRDAHNADMECFVSDDPEKFRRVGQKFLGFPLHEVRLKPVHAAY